MAIMSTELDLPPTAPPSIAVIHNGCHVLPDAASLLDGLILEDAKATRDHYRHTNGRNDPVSDQDMSDFYAAVDQDEPANRLEHEPVLPLSSEEKPSVSPSTPADWSSRFVTPRDFALLKVIGMGAFGKVIQVRHKSSNSVYAMKVMSKRLLRRNANKYVDNIQAERQILAKINKHPFIIMEFLAGGELFLRLGKEGIFLESQVRAGPLPMFHSTVSLTHLPSLLSGRFLRSRNHFGTGSLAFTLHLTSRLETRKHFTFVRWSCDHY
jgi:hypothetical protein